MPYLPGMKLAVVATDVCEEGDCYDKAVLKIVGEVDSFGYETFCMCEKHADEYNKSLDNASEEEQSCDWCHKMSVTVDFYRDWEEGSNGPVYEVCENCRRKNLDNHIDLDDDNDFEDEEEECDEDAVRNVSTEGVLKTGLVGLNRAMHFGGFPRGYFINFAALTHDVCEDEQHEEQCGEEGCVEYAVTLAPRDVNDVDIDTDEGFYCSACAARRNAQSRMAYVKHCYSDKAMEPGFSYVIERPVVDNKALRFEGGSVDDIHKMLMGELKQGGRVSFRKNYYGIFQWCVIRKMELVLRISIINKDDVVDDELRPILMHQ